jgi:alpha-L-rhamnosidase
VLGFSANLAGLPKITGSAPAGTTVTMIPAEQANADGSINTSSTGASPTSQIRYDYTFAGRGTETWHSQFTYNGLQYLEVRGLPARPTRNTVTLLVTHASNQQTASFTSSSDMLDTVYAITQRALENNMQSVLTDCPDREKGPYTGDNVQDVQTDLTLFDMQSYESQLVANMRTSQRPTPLSSQSPGLIANIAPEYHVVPYRPGSTDFLDEPNWAGAVVLIPWQLYQVYGDTTTMSRDYDAMVRWLTYEATNKTANGGNIPGLGDWEAAQSTTAQPVIDSGYYRAVAAMARIATVLGKTSDAATYSALATSLAAEYNTKYLHTDGAGNAWYANNTEASNAIALDAGLVPAQYHQAVVNSVVAAVGAFGNRIGTGSVALGPLFRTLHAAGRDDLVYAMVTNPTGPSYASIVDQGATTLWENLTGSGGSKDHQFLGAVAAWMVHDLVGIDAAPGSLAYRQLVIRPAIVGGLTHASGSYTTPQGQASVSWSVAPSGAVTLQVTIPANTTAEIWVPTSGHPVTAPAGVTVARGDTVGGVRYAVYAAGSGTFRFTA